MTTQKVVAAEAMLAPMGGEILMVPIKHLEESPFNQRRNFGDLRALADTIEAKGVLQPLTVRAGKKSEHYEVVFGHRRLRAAAMAGKKEVPVIVRDMSDKTAAEVQLIENLQREDVHPMDEAEGFDALIKAGHSVEELAARIGKSIGHVYGRLKLLALVPEARKAFLASKVPATIALAIARCEPEVQKKATARIAALEEEPTYRQGLDILRREFGVALSHDFDQKKEAEAKAAFEKAEAEAKEQKRKILDHATNRKVYAYGTNETGHASPYLEAKARVTDPYSGPGEGPTYAKLIGKKLESLEPVLGQRPDGTAVWLYETKALEELAAPEVAKWKQEKQKKAGASAPAKEKEQKKNAERWKKEQELRKLRERTAEAALAAAVEKVKKTKGGRPFWLFLAKAATAGTGVTPGLVARHMPGEDAEDTTEEEFLKAIEKMNEAELRALAFDAAVEFSVTQAHAHYSAELLAMAKLFHIDLKKTEAAVRKKAEAEDEKEAE
jgi:ParB/RepB/Spo0J family partition protein